MFHHQHASKMLFNKNGIGAAEMKSILGFIYASSTFENLATDIELVTDEMIRLIGIDLYSEIESFYQSEHFDTQPGVVTPEEGAPTPLQTWKIWKELVHHTQLPIAFYAYRNYASHADLTHSDKGRQIFVSEFEKPAFEWMIQRDDQSLLLKAHKLTDRLLKFLDDHAIDVKIKSTWTDLPIYAATKSNLISSAQVFSDIFPIAGSRRFYQTVLPFIAEVERTRIIPTISLATYDSLLEFIRNRSTGNETETLLHMVRIPIVLYTMNIAAKRLAVEILPDGVFQNYVSGSQTMKARNPAAMEFKTEVAKVLEDEANLAMTALQQFIEKLSAAALGTNFEPEVLTSRHSKNNQYFRL